MDERNRKQTEPQYDDIYGTGPTNPPKKRRGFAAVLLILVITLCGVSTALGILNVKLFTQLNRREKTKDLSIAVATNAEVPLPELQMTVPPLEPAAAPKNDVSISLNESPKSVDNIPQEGGMALQDIYTKNIPSVVSIRCDTISGTSTGTGVILTADGYIVTNAHVVEGAASLSVQLTDNRVFQAEIIGSDEVSDLAVLHIQAEELTPVEFGDSESLRVGDTVVAIGDPLGMELRGTYTDGIISAINRDVSMDGRTMTLIQTNAALNSGNSGGPLINCYGQVIGINTIKISTFTRSSASVEGLGFAIPSTTVKDIVDQLLSQGYVSGRPTLGLEGETLSLFYQRYYHLPDGMFLTKVIDGSSADLAGIEEGDILLSVDDIRVTAMDELNGVLYSHQVGDTVTVSIYRGGRIVSGELVLTEKTN